MIRTRAGRAGATGLVIALAGALLPLVATSASAIACTGFARGDGSPGNPYLVADATELAAISAPGCLGSVFVQTADIDLGSVANWTPIGDDPAGIYSPSTVPFSGTYYGDCFTIDNMTVNRTVDGSGLFMLSDGGTFRNMKLDNVDVTSSEYEVGALVGYIDDSGSPTTIDAVSVKGSVTGYEYVGMLAGEGNPTLTHVSAEGTLTAADGDAGGLLSYFGGSVTESYARVNISNASSTSGGLVATAQPAATFSDVFATGNVASATREAGGLIGSSFGIARTIENAYATGAVTAPLVTGGLVGEAGSPLTPGVAVTYVDSFWDATTTTQPTTATGTDAVNIPLTTTTGAKTTAQLQTAATYASWDPQVWTIKDGSYPTLKWFDDGGLDYCPRAATLDVASGPIAGGTSVTITGRNWDAATSISFGGAAATVTSTGTNSVTVTTPAGSTGAVDVTATVLVEGVSVPVTLASAFSYAPAGQAPSRPAKPVISSGDGKVKVTVARGSGGGTPATFRVTADPGSGSCTVTSATGGTCTISSGLTNGREYTVRVKAVNEFGTSAASLASEEFVPGPVITPSVQTVTARQPAGGSSLIINGQPAPVVVEANTSSTGLTIRAAGLTMTLDGLNANGTPMNLDANGVLILGQDRDVQSTGTGFMPDSDVKLYVDPKVRAAAAALSRSKGVYVGTLRTDKSGAFNGTATLPGGVSVGVHDLQAVGVTRGNLPRALTLGIKVASVPGAVRNLAADRATAKGTVFLSWKAPKDEGNSPVDRYQVAYRYELATAWVREPNAADAQAEISGLIPGCRYDVRVRAVNGPGAGQWSRLSVVVPTPGRMRLPSGDLRCLVK